MEQGSLVRQPSDLPHTASPQALEPAVRAHLGRQLRAVYDEMASQPVPDRFVQLLNTLEHRQAETSPEAATPSGAGRNNGKKANDS